MKIVDAYSESKGHTIVLLSSHADRDTLKQEVIRVLDDIWVGDIIYADDIVAYNKALNDFGVNLDEEIRARGLDDPSSDKKDRIIKDRGDIGEVLGYIREIQLRGINEDDFFMPLMWNKVKGGSTTHGLDGMGFIWGSQSDPHRMVLCEWKHTVQQSIRDPCLNACDQWMSVTYRKLIQELRRVARIYKERGDHTRADDLKWFAHSWLKRDPNVLCVTMIVYPDSVPLVNARRDFDLHVVDKGLKSSGDTISPEMHEGNLLPLTDLESFLDECYRDFTHGGE